MYVQFFEDALLLGIGKHIHKVRNRRALVTANIGDPGLQQCLGDPEYAFAVEGGAFTQAEFFNFFGKRSFCHLGSLRFRFNSLSGTLKLSLVTPLGTYLFV